MSGLLEKRRAGGTKRSGEIGESPLLAAAAADVTPAAPRMSSRSWSGSLRGDSLVAGGAVLIVALALVHPVVYSMPTLRAAGETVIALFGIAAVALVRRQFLQARRLWQLLLFASLVTLTLTEFLANALPAALHLQSGSAFSGALPLGQLISALLLLGSARTRTDRLILEGRRALFLAVLASTGGLVFAELVGLLLRSQLLPTASSGPGMQVALQRPVAFVVLLITAGLFLGAAVEYGGHAERLEPSPISPLLAKAAILLAAARLYHLALPVVAPEAISAREGFRLLAFGLIFAAALRRELLLWSTAARAAAAAERLRLARDLHDGLAQDLAFIAAHGARLADELGHEHPLIRAARHAVDISRNAVDELSNGNSRSLRETLEATTYELGERFGVDIAVEVTPDAALAADVQNQVGRIAREAIANAARHGEAKHVLVSLKRRGSAWVLRVVDDGCGIAAEAGTVPEGFGVQSMRDRAASLGGFLTLRPAAGRGTDVRVVFR